MHGQTLEELYSNGITGIGAPASKHAGSSAHTAAMVLVLEDDSVALCVSEPTRPSAVELLSRP